MRANVTTYGPEKVQTRCKRLQMVGGKESITVLFTFQGNHPDLFFKVGLP